MTICLKQILFHQEQLKSNLKELFSHFGKYVKQYTNIFAEVGGLLGYPLGEKGSILSGSNADDYTKSGIYAVNSTSGNTTNFPEVSPLGMLIVFKSANNSGMGGTPILQLYLDYSLKHVYLRTKWVNNWYTWKEISFLG